MYKMILVNNLLIHRIFNGKIYAIEIYISHPRYKEIQYSDVLPGQWSGVEDYILKH